MSKPVKPAAAPAAPADAAPPKKSKMKLIIIGVVVLLIAAGAGWYFTQGHPPEDEHAKQVKAEPVHEPKYIPLGENFTVNLQREEGDQYLQAGITLKILQPELEEKIKLRMPEIKSKLLFLLSNKLPSELQTATGKQNLINEIIAETDVVLGLAAPIAASAPAQAAPANPETGGHGDAHGDGHAASAPVAASAVAATPVPLAPKTTGIVDVLFTSFIIQ